MASPHLARGGRWTPTSVARGRRLGGGELEGLGPERSPGAPQNIAYRHAAARLGLWSEQGLVVRLPKLVDDPAWEVMTVPETVTLADFLAAGNLWRWQRRMDGPPEGDRLAPRPSGVHSTGPRGLGTPARVL